jgi:Cu2+-exporting ATPase
MTTAPISSTLSTRPVPKARVACAHCDLPVPPALVDDSAGQQFCCHGCRTVYNLLHTHELDAYYRVRRAAAPAEATPARTTAHDYTELDDETHLAQHATTLPSGLCQTTLLLEGVHCAACVWLVERLPRLNPAVAEARLDLRRARATITWDPATPLSAVATTLDRLGYPAHPPKPSSLNELRKKEDRAWLLRVGLAGALAGNTMLVAFALYGGHFGGMAADHLALFRWISALFGVISLAGPGRLFFRGAMAALRTRSVNLDVPIALALAIGGLWGLSNTIRGVGEIYFDSLTMLVFLLLVGRWLQHASTRRATDALDLLSTLTPSRATVIETTDDGRESRRTVPVHALRIGDVIDIPAEAPIPADAVLITGQTDVDAALLTGESRPIAVGEGDQVHAGTLNLTSPVRACVTATADQARVTKLMRLVEDAANRRAPVVRFADRVAGWFVLVVTVLAALTTVIWWPEGPSTALEHATALLIVSCPCALGLATPLVMTATTGRLARSRILVKGSDAIERLARPGVMLLDKTGTLTTGRPQVLVTFGDADAARLVLEAERHSGHPIAKALVTALDDGLSDRATSCEVTRIPGRGLVAMIDGVPVCVGNAALLQKEGIDLSAEFLDEAAARADAAAGALVLGAVDGHLRFAAVVADTLRPDARATLDALRSRGWKLRILSGDDTRVVRAVARELDIEAADAKGDLTPEDKLAIVRELAGTNDPAGRSRAPVVMIGDGVNDAAALAAASVGIAVQGGAEASLEAADVAVQTPGLAPLAELFGDSRRAMLRVRLCLAASLTYNASAATLAVAGLISPLAAAILMPASSITVLLIAVASIRKSGPSRTI